MRTIQYQLFWCGKKTQDSSKNDSIRIERETEKGKLTRFESVIN